MNNQRPACLACREYPTELDDLLGHERIGHEARNVLAREGVTTREQLALIPDARLLEFEGFGRACLARVRSRVPAPAAAAALLSDFAFRGGLPS